MMESSKEDGEKRKEGEKQQYLYLSRLSKQDKPVQILVVNLSSHSI